MKSIVKDPDIRLGTWSELGARALPLRMAVFVREQQVPAEIEHDEGDFIATHAVLERCGDGVIATGRVLPSGKIGRLAVAKPFRGQGMGQRVLLQLMAHAFENGHSRVCLHAQAVAQGFYEKFGFVASGEPFEEAGIAHILMIMDQPS